MPKKFSFFCTKEGKVKLFKRDPLGYAYAIKYLLIAALGGITYRRYRKHFNIHISGTEYLQDLDSRKVMFVANHQTYFSEVILFYHFLCAWKNGRKLPFRSPWYLLNPILDFYYVAATETMKSGWLPKLFAYTGSVSIKRTWREGGKDISRMVDMRDITNIGQALEQGWLMNFPQGTTTPFAKGRRGIIHIIRKYDPVIVPVVFDGFARGFSKKNLDVKQPGSLSMRIKAPLQLDLNQKPEQLLEAVMDAIEQSDRFRPGRITN